MINTTIVAFLALSKSLLPVPDFSPELIHIESEWATIQYQNTPQQQAHAFPLLLTKIHRIQQRYPNRPEFQIWEAIVMANNAAYESPFKALKNLETVKETLEEIASRQPETLEGAALVTLGTLYYKVPGWPISFGNHDKAQYYLTKALAINPTGIDTNYFYADFLIEQGQYQASRPYLEAALQAPVRPSQTFADNQLKQQVKASIQKINQQPGAQARSLITNPLNF